MCSLDVEPSSDRANASVLALRPPIEEAQRIQSEGLAGLRRRLTFAADGAIAMRIPLHTVDTLLACLEATLERGTDACARLFSLLVPSEDEASAFERPALEVARLLRRLRASHETMLGLLEFARRVTATFTCPPGSSPDEQTFYEVLAVWVEREQARVRLESDGLLARAQALFPALGQALQPVALGVRCREILSQGGRRRLSSTFCPAERKSVGLEWCRGCPLALHVDQDAVHCLPGVEPLEASADATRLGENAFVGEVVGRRQLSVLPEVAAGEIARVVSGESTGAIPVVDDGDRLVGLIDPGVLESSSPGSRAAGLARESPCIPEGASLADAVEFMVRTHARYLPVVREDGSVVGVLADLDALRWVALHR